MKTLLFVSFFGFALQAESATTALEISSSNSHIVPGNFQSISSEEAKFIVNGLRYNGLIVGDMEYFNFTVSSSTNSDWWHMSIGSTPSNLEALLKVGVYENAGRFVRTEGRPEIDFSGRGSGYNQTFGRFEVLEIGRDDSGKIDKIAFDFTQWGVDFDGNLYDRIDGKFRYNSSLPIPEPSTTVLLSFFGFLIWKRRR